MTPNNPLDLLLPNAKIDRLIRKSKAASKAARKARRKLAQAVKVKTAAEMRCLIGMAQVALCKAEFLARSRK